MPGSVCVGVGVAVWAPAGEGPAGAGLPLPDDLVLVGCRRGSHGEGLWALPGGWVEWGEPFTATGSRELAEEAGIFLASASCTVGELRAAVEPTIDESIATKSLVEVEGPVVKALACPACSNIFGADKAAAAGRLGGRPKDDVSMHSVTVFVGARLTSVVAATRMEPGKCDEWRWVPLRELARSCTEQAEAAGPEAGAAAASEGGAAGFVLFPSVAAFVGHCMSVAAAAPA